MANRHIPEETIATARALHNSGMSTKRVAMQLGLSRDTVRRWVADELPPHGTGPAVEATEREVTARVATNMDLFLVKASDVMATDEFVAHMATRPKDLAVGVGIVTERRELLLGRGRGGTNVTIQVALVAPGALRQLAGAVIEGEYRTETPGLASPATAPVPEPDKEAQGVS